MGLFNNLNFDKLKNGLAKTRDKLFKSINETITGRVQLDEKTINELEEILITSDIGYDLTEKIIDRARYYHRLEKNYQNIDIIESFKNELVKVLSSDTIINSAIDMTKNKPHIILIIGVNGVGKTTTIGKLAHNFKKSGLKVIVGAADTFRAAASEQLDIWADRAGAEIIQKPKGTDPSSVAFETVNKGVKENYDVVIIDTAGRLHNKTNLMNELDKIKRVISKIIPSAPHETLLVLDGTTGQNAVVQAEEFSKVTDISGLVITKLDGTAKGGVVFQICSKLKIPVKYIGVGEGLDDLQSFDPDLFVSAIFTN
jgi:fused signal recognition particle receptor